MLVERVVYHPVRLLIRSTRIRRHWRSLAIVAGRPASFAQPLSAQPSHFSPMEESAAARWRSRGDRSAGRASPHRFTGPIDEHPCRRSKEGTHSWRVLPTLKLGTYNGSTCLKIFLAKFENSPTTTTETTGKDYAVFVPVWRVKRVRSFGTMGSSRWWTKLSVLAAWMKRRGAVVSWMHVVVAEESHYKPSTRTFDALWL